MSELETNVTIDDDYVYDLLISNFQCSVEDLHKATTLAETLENLEALKSTIDTFGMSRELLAFADHDGVLSQAIPEIPSLESYMADNYIDLSAATEAITDSIKKTMVKFIDVFMAHVTRFKKWYIRATQFLAYTAIAVFSHGALIPVIIHITTAATINSAVVLAALTAPYVIIPVITATTIIIALHLCRSVPLAISESLDLKLPTTVQERASYIRKVKNIFMSRAKINIDKIGVAVLSESETGKTARELGYTKEAIEEIVHDIKASIAEIDRCNFIPDRLQHLSQTVEATTSNGRAALVFITNVITKTLHLAVAETMASVNQLKKLDNAVLKVVHEHADELTV